MASSTCHDAISNCQVEVLWRYISHLVEREQVTSAVAGKVESLLDSVWHESNDVGSLLNQVCLVLCTNTMYLFQFI